MDNDEAAKKTDLLNEAKDLLIRWENEDSEVRELWNKMNGWVYDGFDLSA